MWFCTDAGVCRFDGYTFKTYDSQSGLPDNTVFNIYEDRHGRIWFAGMSKKLSYYLPARDSIVTVACGDRLAKHLAATTISSLYLGNGDTLYVGTNAGESFFKIPPGDNYKQLIPMADTTGGWQMYSFGQGQWLWGVAIQPKKLTRYTMNLYNYPSRLPFYSYARPGVMPMSERYRYFSSSAGCIYLSEDVSLYYKSPGSIVKRKDFANSIIALYTDKAGNLWCGFKRGGVCRFERGDLSMPPQHYLSDLSITGICQDQEGGYWFSTLEQGVYYAPSFHFTYYDRSCGIPGNKVYSVLNHAGKIFCFSDRNEMSIIDSGRVSSYPLIGTKAYNIEGQPASILVTADSSYIYDFETKRGKVICEDGPGKRYFIRQACAASPGEVYVVSSAGLELLDTRTGRLFALAKPHTRLLSLCADGKNVWLGSPNGLYKYTGGGLENEGGRNPLLSHRIDDICFDWQHRLWLATKEAGIIIKDGENIIHISRKNGLASNLCRSLLVDSGRMVWVGTNRGISKIVFKSDTEYTIENYTHADGLLSDEVNGFCVLGNDLYAATNQGVIRFDKTRLSPAKVPPPVYITGFMVNDVEKTLEQRYTLSHNENFVRVKFLGLSYKDPGNLVYKYKLEGLDTAWHYTHNTAVQYTTLPPGDYTFVVYSINAEGIGSLRPSCVSFCVHRPFWKTWWFILLIAATVFGITYLFFTDRIRRVKKTAAEKTTLNKKIAEVELKAIRAQMNPHFIFNSINSIQHYILSNDSDTAYRYLSKFSKLIRNVLENSRHEFISIQREIDTIELYIELEKLRFETRFEHELQVERSIDTLTLAISPLLIQPYVENAIWHGLMPGRRPGLLSIRFTDEQTLIKCVIEDNGVGRERSREIRENNARNHRSMALSLNEERLEIIGHLYKNKLQIRITDLEDEGGNPSGTRVEVYIPKINFNDHDKSHHS